MMLQKMTCQKSTLNYIFVFDERNAFFVKLLLYFMIDVFFLAPHSHVNLDYLLTNLSCTVYARGSQKQNTCIKSTWLRAKLSIMKL